VGMRTELVPKPAWPVMPVFLPSPLLANTAFVPISFCRFPTTFVRLLPDYSLA